MSEIQLNNEWNASSQRDAAITMHDRPAMDTRNFSRVTKSQLNSSKAIDKTLRYAHNHRSQCLSYAKTAKAKNALGYNQIKKIKDQTSLTANNILTIKFWDSFQKHAITSLTDDASNSNSNCSTTSGASVPVLELERAINSLTEREVGAEVQNIVHALGFQPTESLSWKEYKNVCNRLFDPTNGKVNNSHSLQGESLSLSQESFQSEAGSHSISYQSMDNSAADLMSDGLPHKSQSYSKLQRKHRGVSSIAPNKAHQDITDFSPAESTVLAPVKKDALCEVLKNEYRKIRKDQLPESSRRLQDGEKRYLQQTQKNKIAAMRNKGSLVPLQWRAVREKKAAREAIIQNYKNRKDMIQAFKTVVNAQERNATNRDVMNKDEEAMAKIEDNSMKRYIENEITSRNIKTWKANEKKIRHDLRAEYRDKMIRSVAASRQMIEEEKAFRKFMLNEGTDMGSKTLSKHTSTMFDVPEEIGDRIRGARKLSSYEEAKADAQRAFEKEYTRRVVHYNAVRQQAIKQAEDFGCGITIHPMRGSDYFEDFPSPTASAATIASTFSSKSYSQPLLPSQRMLVSQGNPAAAKYFDSASTVTYPGQAGDGCFDSSCPPVYLDPNYDPSDKHQSVSSKLYKSAPERGSKNAKNTEVADAIRRYDDDDFGDSVVDSSGAKELEMTDEDALSITDSIDSCNNDDDQDLVLK